MELLLLPGLDGTGRLARSFVAALPDAITSRVLAYPQRPGFGYDELLAWLAPRVPERPYVVLGESFGGPLALRHAAQRPPRLRGLVLVASFAASPLRRFGRVAARFGSLGLGLGARPLARWLLAGREAPPRLVDELLDAVGSVPRQVLSDRLRAVVRVDVRESLPAIEVPVLALTGTRDRLVGPRALRSLDRVTDLNVVALDAPHLVLQRRPAEAAAIVARFVADAVP